MPDISNIRLGSFWLYVIGIASYGTAYALLVQIVLACPVTPTPLMPIPRYGSGRLERALRVLFAPAHACDRMIRRELWQP